MAANKSKKAKPKAKAKPNLKKKSASRKSPAKKTVQLKSTSKGARYLTPLDDRVLIEITPRDNKTAGGIFIPDTVETQHTRGTVVAVGRGRRNKKGYVRPMDVKVGDEVLYAQYAGTPVTIDSKSLLLMKEEELLGVIEE